MFGRKPKRRQLFIEVYDAQGATLISCGALDYALPEDMVVRLSTEYFNDPEPCEIHRAAVLKRVMMELIDSCGSGRVTPAAALKEEHRRCLPAAAAAVCIREGSA